MRPPKRTSIAGRNRAVAPKSVEPEQFVWLNQKCVELLGDQYKTVWDVYIKFYTAYLAMQIVAIGATLQFIQDGDAKGLIAIVFIAQNALSGFTAIAISCYSWSVHRRGLRLSRALLALDGAGESSVKQPLSLPLATRLGIVAGIANAISHLLYAVCWKAVTPLPLAQMAKLLVKHLT